MTYIHYGLKISINCIPRATHSDGIHIAKSKDRTQHHKQWVDSTAVDLAGPPAGGPLGT